MFKINSLKARGPSQSKSTIFQQKIFHIVKIIPNQTKAFMTNDKFT